MLRVSPSTRSMDLFDSKVQSSNMNRMKSMTPTPATRVFMAPSFMLDEIKIFKPYIIPNVVLKQEIENQKFKLYKPYLLTN